MTKKIFHFGFSHLKFYLNLLGFDSGAKILSLIYIYNVFFFNLGKFDLVQKMFSSGNKIDVNAVDADGATPLIYACMSGNIDIVLLLLKAGAKTDIQDQLHGWTALMQATLKQCVS